MTIWVPQTAWFLIPNPPLPVRSLYLLQFMGLVPFIFRSILARGTKLKIICLIIKCHSHWWLFLLLSPYLDFYLFLSKCFGLNPWIFAPWFPTLLLFLVLDTLSPETWILPACTLYNHFPFECYLATILSSLCFSETPIRQTSELLTLASISLNFLFIFSSTIALSALPWTFSLTLV